MIETFDFELHNRLYEGGHGAELIRWDLEMKKNPMIGINGLNGNTFFEIEPTSQVKSYELEALLLNGTAKIIDIEEAENTLREEFKKDSDFIMRNEQSYSENIIEKENIDIIFPTMDEGLLKWAQKKDYFKNKYDTDVIISNEKTIDICIDKWKTFLFFKENNIPTPETSLKKIYNLLKTCRYGNMLEDYKVEYRV